MNYLQIFINELKLRGISWCTGQCGREGHRRGFVVKDEPVVHYDTKIATRKTLRGGLHEIAHAFLNEKGMRRFEAEAQAERWSIERMRELGVSIPRGQVASGQRYVKRMKRWGDAIRAGRKK